MYRAVEGQVHYWWVGLGNVIGSTLLAYFWDDISPALATSWDKVNLLKTFGPLGGLLVTYACCLSPCSLLLAGKNSFSAAHRGRQLRRPHEYRTRLPSGYDGEPCPYPAVATLEALPQLKKGEILEVVSDCPQSINNIPVDARNHGYTVLDIQQDGPTIRYMIQK
jgi:TusA-related sulfurtransferase